MTTLVITAFRNSIDSVDEKSKQHTESKQYSQSYGQNAPGSPSASAHSGYNLSSRPATSQLMSPGHCLPTGMANLDKSETMPEIQMPSMATLDPFLRGSSEQEYSSTFRFLQLLI